MAIEPRFSVENQSLDYGHNKEMSSPGKVSSTYLIPARRLDSKKEELSKQEATTRNVDLS